MTDELNYSIEDHDGIKIINLEGNLSISNAETFEHLVDSYVDKSNVILNMQRVNIITSSGMHSLMNVSLDARGSDHRVMIMKPGKDFLYMLELMKNYEFFIIIDSIEEGRVKAKYYT